MVAAVPSACLMPGFMVPTRRTLVLGDLHLARATPRAVSDDLATLVRNHPGDRLVFAGDLFDLSAEAPERPQREALGAVLAHHAAAGPALAEHAERGGELWFVGGNHDAHVAERHFKQDLAEVLGLSAASQAHVRHTPWFFREGGLHIEHGHLYDPDNAPAHPLVVGEPSLGVHFVEQFIAPTGAHAYLHHNAQPPLQLFLASFKWYGKRAPYVIYRYFYTAFTAMFRSGPFYRAHPEKAAGELEVARFMDEAGLSAEMIDELLALGAKPTMESLAATFSRIYFDRVLSTVAMGMGLGGLALGRPAAGALLCALGAAGMAHSWSHGKSRYVGRVVDRLADSAKRIGEVSQAKLVIFGHTHCEALDGVYANTASFAFSAGRPYLEVEGGADSPRAVRRYFANDAGR